MMKKLREFLSAKDKPVLLYIAMAAAVGVFLLLFGGMFDTPKPDSSQPSEIFTAEDVPEGTAEAELFAKEQSLEKRLEDAFAMMEDVGRVRVVLGLSPDRETVYAADVNATESVTRETDAAGGSRETTSRTRDGETIIFTDKTGTDRPLVLREIEQKIEGAVIIAEGGDNVFVKDALTKAACTVLGVEANKVQVLKMKK